MAACLAGHEGPDFFVEWEVENIDGGGVVGDF